MKSLVIILSVHIYVVQTKLLTLLNGGGDFSYLSLDERSILAMVFAISYAAATAIVLYKTKNKRLIILFAGMDAAAVLLYYFTKIPLWVGAFYFSAYTFVIIASTISLGRDKKGSRYTQRQLAKELGISESKLSRAVKKVEGRQDKRNY